jgi:hypothetical protein
VHQLGANIFARLHRYPSYTTTMTRTFLIGSSSCLLTLVLPHRGHAQTMEKLGENAYSLQQCNSNVNVVAKYEARTFLGDKLFLVERCDIKSHPNSFSTQVYDVATGVSLTRSENTVQSAGARGWGIEDLLVLKGRPWLLFTALERKGGTGIYTVYAVPLHAETGAVDGAEVRLLDFEFKAFDTGITTASSIGLWLAVSPDGERLVAAYPERPGDAFLRMHLWTFQNGSEPVWNAAHDLRMHAAIEATTGIQDLVVTNSGEVYGLFKGVLGAGSAGKKDGGQVWVPTVHFNVDGATIQERPMADGTISHANALACRGSQVVRAGFLQQMDGKRPMDRFPALFYARSASDLAGEAEVKRIELPQALEYEGMRPVNTHYREDGGAVVIGEFYKKERTGYGDRVVFVASIGPDGSLEWTRSIARAQSDGLTPLEHAHAASWRSGKAIYVLLPEMKENVALVKKGSAELEKMKGDAGTLVARIENGQGTYEFLDGLSVYPLRTEERSGSAHLTCLGLLGKSRAQRICVFPGK